MRRETIGVGWMSKLSSWATSLAQNLFANAVWTFVCILYTGAAVWLASLAPALKPFAPFSYLIAALVSVAVLLCVIIAAVTLWRSLRPESAATAGNNFRSVEYSNSLKEIDEALKRQKDEQGAFNQWVATQFQKVDERLSEVDKTLGPIRRQQRREMAQQVVDALRFFSTPTAHNPHALPRRGTFKGTNHPLMDNLRELGYSENNQVSQAAEQEIRGREEYRTLYANEQPQWASVAAKLNFHVEKARLEALANYIAQKEGLYERPERPLRPPLGEDGHTSERGTPSTDRA